MTTLADRFRLWYAHEQDCNAKTLAMLESVPEARRDSPDFQRALDLMAHLVMARRMWLSRLGRWPRNPAGWTHHGATLPELRELLAPTEAAWVEYLKNLSDDALARELSWTGMDGNGYRWPVELVLTQVSGHAWYHRGQIAVLVGQLGGKTTSTDLIFWQRPARVAAGAV